VGAAGGARAEEPNVTRARELFVRGGQLVREAQWAEALAAFEESARLKPHPITTYDVGACHRATGRYTLARKLFAAALAENDRAGGAEMSPAVVSEVRGAAAEVDRLLAVIDLEISPEGTLLAIDGRPLEATAVGLVAGTRAAGPAEPAPPGKLSLRVDPGAHTIVLARPGFADSVQRVTSIPGGKTALHLELDRLPARIHVASNIVGAQVLVNEVDVGLTPIEVSRPAGAYHVTVRKKGFVTYDVDARAQPGQSVDLAAPLKEDRPALTQRWWFWGVAGVVVAGAAIGTYFLTRPDPTRPPPNGGGLGWTVEAP
jgi:hypothetical protein